MNPDQQISKIKSIRCLSELAGYEAQAKERGLIGEEIAALHAKRKELTPKRKRGRK